MAAKRTNLDPLPEAAHPSVDTNTGVTLLLGEMRGQVRELVHTINNMSMKMDALSNTVAENSSIPAAVSNHEVRLAALEAKHHRQEGAMGVGGWLIKSPMLGWLATALVAGWAALHGAV